MENCNTSFILNDSASVRAKKGDVSVKVYASAICVFENCNVYFDGYTANESSILSMENCVVSGAVKGEATYKISSCKISRLEFGDNPVCDITDCTGDNAYISLSWSLCEKSGHVLFRSCEFTGDGEFGSEVNLYAVYITHARFENCKIHRVTGSIHSDPCSNNPFRNIPKVKFKNCKIKKVDLTGDHCVQYRFLPPTMLF